MRYVIILLIILIVFALTDCIRHDDTDVPVGMPKAIWVVLIVIFPGAGAIAWLVVSRVNRRAQQTAGPARPPSPGPPPFPGRSPGRRPVTRQVAPDDDPEFLASLNQPDSTTGAMSDSQDEGTTSGGASEPGGASGGTEEPGGGASEPGGASGGTDDETSADEDDDPTRPRR